MTAFGQILFDSSKQYCTRFTIRVRFIEMKLEIKSETGDKTMGKEKEKALPSCRVQIYRPLLMAGVHIRYALRESLFCDVNGGVATVEGTWIRHGEIARACAHDASSQNRSPDERYSRPVTTSKLKRPFVLAPPPWRQPSPKRCGHSPRIRRAFT